MRGLRGQQMATGCRNADVPHRMSGMPAPGETLNLHPDRLLPTDVGVRRIARRLYHAVRDLPILSPHGHVDAGQLLDNRPFADPAGSLVTPDHYVTRLL